MVQTKIFQRQKVKSQYKFMILSTVLFRSVAYTGDELCLYSKQSTFNVLRPSVDAQHGVHPFGSVACSSVDTAY